MLHTLNRFLAKCLLGLGEFIGIDKQATERWIPIFERKILGGDVGLSLTWATDSHGVMVLETETLVRELSNTDSVQGVLDEMQRLTGFLEHRPMCFSSLPPGFDQLDTSSQNSRTDINTSRNVYDHDCQSRLDECPTRVTSLTQITDDDDHHHDDDNGDDDDDYDDDDNADNQIPYAHRGKHNCVLQRKNLESYTIFARRSKPYRFCDDMDLVRSRFNENFTICYQPIDATEQNFCNFRKNTDPLSYLNLFIDNQVGMFHKNLSTNLLLDSCAFEIIRANSHNSQGIGTDTQTLSSNFQAHLESNVDPCFQDSDRIDQSMKPEYATNIHESGGQTRDIKNICSHLKSILHGTLVVIIKLLLCKFFLPWKPQDKKKLTPQSAAAVEAFLTKHTARNPLYMTASRTSKDQNLKTNADEEIQFLQGKEAFDYYKMLSTTETLMNIQQMKSDERYLKKLYTRRKRLVEELVEAAKDFYKAPTDEKRLKWKHLKRNIEETTPVFSEARKYLSVVGDKIPFFTLALMLCQAALLIIVCSILGLETGIQSYKKTEVNIPTLLGSEAFTVVREPNPWIGPSERFFWVAAAAVTLCMGGNSGSLAAAQHTRESKEATSDQNQQQEIGCCEMASHFNRAGSTTFADCIKMTTGLGQWRGGVLCSQRTAPNNQVAHVIKPCCEARTGTCRMLSHEHCVLIKGVFHIALDHCGQTNCLHALCRLKKNDMTAILPKDNRYLKLTWLDWFKWVFQSGKDRKRMLVATNSSDDASSNFEAPYQWWRLLTALPLTFGLLHLLLVVLLQVAIMLPVEMYAGWHRAMLIYVCSALAGEMMACSVEPSRPHVGSTGGAAGFISVALLELGQAWSFLPHPWRDAAGLAGVTLFFLLLGTLHLVSLASVLAGLVVGASVGLMVVPYITFGHRLRAVLVGLALFLAAEMVIHFCYTSALSPMSHLQSGLLNRLRRTIGNWECVPYSEQMCLTYTRT